MCTLCLRAAVPLKRWAPLVKLGEVRSRHGLQSSQVLATTEHTDDFEVIYIMLLIYVRCVWVPRASRSVPVKPQCGDADLCLYLCCADYSCSKFKYDRINSINNMPVHVY